MKELSIEEKAKTPDGNYNAYTELINRLEDVKEAIKKQNYGIAMDVLCKPYPEFQITASTELKESEDERIRKELLNAFQEAEDSLYMALTPNRRKSFIAWLEKQGNLMKALQISNANIGELVEKNYYLKEQLEKRGKNNMGISEATKQKLEDNLNKALEKETPESCNEFLEKQGEQKPIKEHNACEFCEDRYGCVSPCSMKLIEEEKFTNKVEPKFKIEEEKWYVCTQTFVLRGKIVVIKGQTYQAEKDNAIKGEDGCLFIDKHDGKASDYFRYWTIQDAKDGDILFTSSTASHETFIFKNINKEGNIECYFSYDSEDGFREGKYHFIGRAINCKPATKKQSELLFKKIKELGYKWDSEKKELKKIEQKKELTAFEFSLKHIIEEAIECGDIHNLKADADLLLRIAQKTSWSEEDNRMCKAIIDNIQAICEEGYFVGNIDSDELIKWLKSLEERVQSQQQEWSEENKRIYKSIAYSFAHNYPLTVQQQEFVKSLKDRYTWKPSDEQMDAIDYVKNFDYGGYKDMLVSLYYDLKKLK